MSMYRLASGRSTAAGLVNSVGTVLALILVAHIVFVLVHANPGNEIVGWATQTSAVIALWFINVVDTGDAVFSTVVNYGLAAVFWLVVTGAIARVLRSVG